MGIMTFSSNRTQKKLLIFTPKLPTAALSSLHSNVWTESADLSAQPLTSENKTSTYTHMHTHTASQCHKHPSVLHPSSFSTQKTLLNIHCHLTIDSRSTLVVHTTHAMLLLHHGVESSTHTHTHTHTHLSSLFTACCSNRRRDAFSSLKYSE